MKVGRIILDSEESTQPLPNLTKLVERWLSRDVDPVTLSGYRFKINHFVSWYADRFELHPSSFVEFVDHLRNAGQTEANIYQILQRTKQFFRWLHLSGITPDFDVSKWFPTVRVDRLIRVPAPLDALSRLMFAAAHSAYPERNQAMIATMLGTGIRRNECASLTIEDVTIDADGSGMLIVRKAKRVKGRSVHQRAVAFDAATGKYIRTWLDKLDTRTGPLWPSYSFMSDEHDSLTAQGIYKVVNACIESAGLVGVVTGCHDLRRLFVTYFRRNLRGEAHDKLLRMQVGHLDKETTDLYDLSGVEEIREVIISPLALMSEYGIRPK